MKGMIAMANANGSKAEPQVLYSALMELERITPVKESGSGGQGVYQVKGAAGGTYFPREQFEAAGQPGVVRVTISAPSEEDVQELVKRMIGSGGRA